MTQSDAMVRALLIAAVIVLPYAVFKIRQVRLARTRHDEIVASETEAARRANDPFSDLPALEDVIGDVDYVVAESQRSGGAMLVVPYEVTVSDRPTSPEIVDVLVRDALRRSGLAVTAEIDSSEGRIYECALLAQSKQRQPQEQ